MACRVIIAAYREEGLCSGPADAQALSARARQLVEEAGLEVLRLDPVDREGCFAAIMHCCFDPCGVTDLVWLRERLRLAGQPSRLLFRVQREELFLAMHRV